MNYESQLKLQAYLDGELSAWQSRRVAAWLTQDAEARMLLAELQNTRTALQGNGLEVKLPESGEFFWSKIEREILRSRPAQTGREPVAWRGWSWLRQRLVPVSALAALAVMLTAAVLQYGGLSTAAYSQLEEMETPLDDITAFAFRSHSSKMTVVWIKDRSNQEVTDSEVLDNINPQ